MTNGTPRQNWPKWWLIILPLLLPVLLANGLLVQTASATATDAVRTSGASPVLAPNDTPTATHSVCVAAWQVVSSPNSSTIRNDVYGVAVVSTNDVWAVGYYLAPGIVEQTLIEHWNGSQWSVVAGADIGSSPNILYGVAAVSANDVWAVGVLFGSAAQTLIEHWNGSQWSIVPSPNVGSSSNYLTAVEVVAANDIWAVGHYAVGFTGQTLVEHWNGSQWSVVTSPNPGSTDDELSGVAAVSANDVWAVGVYSDDSPFQTLIEHWNGSTWNVVSSPNVGSGSNYLNAVATVSANDVWAVGYYGGSTLVEHWDGSQWSVASSPSPGSSSNELYGVAAVTANDVWAVGSYYNGTATQTLMEHWDGGAWSVMSSPSPGSSANSLRGVAALSANDVWAVGKYISGTLSQTLMERHSGPCGTPPPTNTPTRTPVSATNTPIPPSATPTPRCPGEIFSDVCPSDYFYTPVMYLYNHGVLSGYGTEFRPYNNTSRGQLCKIMVLGFYLTINVEGGPHFTDVPVGSIFFSYIETLYNRGTISGYGTEFRPNDNVSRGQLSKIVVLTAAWPLRTPTTATFTDVPTGSTFFSYVETAYCHGIISGYGTLFKPNDPATRGQISKIVYLALTSTTVCP